MVRVVNGKISKLSQNRHCIYLRSALVADDDYPFDENEEVLISIKGKTLIVTRA